MSDLLSQTTEPKRKDRPSRAGRGKPTTRRFCAGRKGRGNEAEGEGGEVRSASNMGGRKLGERGSKFSKQKNNNIATPFFESHSEVAKNAHAENSHHTDQLLCSICPGEGGHSFHPCRCLRATSPPPIAHAGYRRGEGRGRVGEGGWWVTRFFASSSLLVSPTRLLTDRLRVRVPRHNHTLHVHALVLGLLEPRHIRGRSIAALRLPLHHDRVQHQPLHRPRVRPHQHTRGRVPQRPLATHPHPPQRHVAVEPLVPGVALGEGVVGPADGAGVCRAQVDRVALLRGSDPDRPPGHAAHADVLVEHVLDRAAGGAGVAELHVYALHRLTHDALAEGYVAHRACTDGADRKTQARGGDALHNHVADGVLDRHAVVLVPDLAVVHVHACRVREIEAVRVERGERDEAVRLHPFVVVPHRGQQDVPDLHPRRVLRVQRPVRRVPEVHALNDHVRGVLPDVQQAGSVLAPHGVAHKRDAPPLVAEPVDHARRRVPRVRRRRHGGVEEVRHVRRHPCSDLVESARHEQPRATKEGQRRQRRLAVARPRLQVRVGEEQAALYVEREARQVLRHDAAHQHERRIRREQEPNAVAAAGRRRGRLQRGVEDACVVLRGGERGRRAGGDAGQAVEADDALGRHDGGAGESCEEALARHRRLSCSESSNEVQIL
eukprot:Rhum_TRINITY_DN9839_c0_g1::Rhum_TRINITY_DN9839_c0_g1_i1::g.35350::m.35350